MSSIHRPIGFVVAVILLACTRSPSGQPPLDVTVTVVPSTATLVIGGAQAFTATVSGVANTAVTWTITEGDRGGTIDTDGVYVASESAGSYHVVATSQADPTKTATATVSVHSPGVPSPVIISPIEVLLAPGQNQQFTASVSNSSNTSVSWTVQEGSAGGSVSSTGLYTAPAAGGNYHVVATSQADPTRSATATVTVTAGTGSGYSLPADRGTVWNPGIVSDGQLGLALGASRLPVRTTTCATVNASTYGNGASDAAAGINAAIASCPAGQVVQLSSGTFRIDSDYIALEKGVVLRGAGAGATILKRTIGAKPATEAPGPSPTPVVILGPARWTNHPNTGVVASTNLAADAAKGSTSIAVASASGFSVGQVVLLDELSGAQWMNDPQGRGKVWASPDWRVTWQLHSPAQQTDDPLVATTPTSGDAAGWFCRQDRPTSEVKQIAAISGNTVTFTTPVHISYRTSHSAQLSRYEYTHVQYAGLEALTVSGGDDGNVRFHWCANCWAANVESTVWEGEGFAIDSSFRVVVRDSYVHDAAWAQPGGAGYALSFSTGSSESLVENDVIVRANKVMVARSSGAASVIGYNYVDEGYINTNGAWIEVHLNGSHMVGPHHMLFEGNYGPNWDSDKTHGSAIYHTVFRNHLRGIRASFTNQLGGTINDASQPGDGPRRCAGAAAYSYWHSFVGNVLGLPGQMSGWAYQAVSGNDTMSSDNVWLLGWDDWSPQPSDPTVAPTILRDGNFDYVTNSVRWEGIGGAGSTALALPDSLYLTSKPAFFGSNTWPWVDPTGTTKLYALPAKARFDAGTPNLVP